MSLTSVQSQDIDSKKIYFLFEKNNDKISNYKYLKFLDKSGINFNLNREAFIHTKNHSIDTLSQEKLCFIKFTEESELKSKEKEWWKSNIDKLKKKYRNVGIIPPFDRNGIFDPYIIEKIANGKMIIYQVDFRNEGNID